MDRMTSPPLADSADREAVPLARAARRPRLRRVWALLLLLACGGVLGLAGYLKPSARGFGTHQQLGLAPCGMILTMGLPCPTCGMTTAFAYTVRAQPAHALRAQPTGFLLALATIATAAGALWTLITGRVPPVRVPLLTPYQLLVVFLLLLFGGWGIKIGLGLLDGTLPVRSVFV
ncbi:MAG TPA: DUF2752 domain-containing protein [Phycisphaerae bacterium]|nr:DUF2752 domain-containing protein [Phycisphaerae bacterium]